MAAEPRQQAIVALSQPSTPLGKVRARQTAGSGLEHCINYKVVAAQNTMRFLCILLLTTRAWQPSRIARAPTHLRASTNEAEGVRRGLESVVCVFSTTAAPDYGQPWALYAEEDVTGSGFWVSSTQVVTNEHVIKHARDVRVRPHGSARKLKCRVAFASAERDLALLEVVDDAIVKPPVLNFAQSLPELYSAVAVVGYPLGGDNICVTRGVVSRLDAMSYGGEGRGERLLVVQIDAGVNSGTSGGPALDERGRVAGVAFSSYAGSADNIGYLVPASVVEAFLPVWKSTGASGAQRWRGRPGSAER